MREPVVFTVEGQRVLGVVHRPQVQGKVPGVAIFHGFTGTKVEPHRIFVKLAEALSEAGIMALRIDFRGSGDSEGDFEAVTFEGEITDARASLDWLSSDPQVDPERLGVLGLSLGGAVAACVRGRDPRVKAATLWAAIADFQKSPFPERLLALGDSQTVDCWGNRVGRDLLEGAMRVHPHQEILGGEGSVLLVHGTADTVVPPESASMYQEALGEKAQLIWVEGGDHTFNREDWEKQAILETCRFFQRKL